MKKRALTEGSVRGEIKHDGRPKPNCPPPSPTPKKELSDIVKEYNMLELTPLGKVCKFKANFHCLSNENTDPNRSCSGGGYFSNCRFSYCPLKDKRWYFVQKNEQVCRICSTIFDKRSTVCTKCGTGHFSKE